MTSKSRYYYEYNRNKSHDVEVDYSVDKTPSYYIGKTYGYEARKVVEDFNLSYNLGTAVTYLLRAENKHDSPIDCIQKAINHLEFELDKLKNGYKTNI
jgi:ribosome-associated translation inhibitor RaiA|tara:strand:+ start:222 stop:515 length:294 start_codon:yes stop_codon:yes gene_type:complete